jgi:ubiquitin carboxyl-terminal hydrolase L5
MLMMLPYAAKVFQIFTIKPDRNYRQPVYGLIFLFEFKQDDPELQESTCPDHIWFANQVGITMSRLFLALIISQTTNNACATIALLNILLNIKSVDIGPSLSSLKACSMAMDPSMRGYAVGNDEFIRSTHNQFVQSVFLPCGYHTF